ncbi:MAG: hypothetical protein HKUEN01_22620 [Candidatus Kuenenia stuttgartiensis]|jgi:hypothetical protein|nr:MAG: hypothetical protein CV080_00975 [Candidatus Kuenenia stuttgartiensis]GJQ49876.1 MAG: hypothetical protein HKUEN01_22620 [Candidatus Kuenenia stuttgartiensis]
MVYEYEINAGLHFCNFREVNSGKKIKRKNVILKIFRCIKEKQVQAKMPTKTDLPIYVRSF